LVCRIIFSMKQDAVLQILKQKNAELSGKFGFPVYLFHALHHPHPAHTA
jgi:hypothetical protein